MLCIHSSAKNPFSRVNHGKKFKKLNHVAPTDMLKLAGLLVNLDYDRSASDEGQKGLQSACE